MRLRILKEVILVTMTSRFSNPELRSGQYTVVGIVRFMPRFPLAYPVAGNIKEIAPPANLFHVYDRGIFTAPYKEHLNSIGVENISERLQHYAAFGKDVVLCCYEDVRQPDEWCHRLVFAEWWLEQTGEQIVELPDFSPIRTPRKSRRS